jgi:hypothetical protein
MTPLPRPRAIEQAAVGHQVVDGVGEPLAQHRYQQVGHVQDAAVGAEVVDQLVLAAQVEFESKV